MGIYGRAEKTISTIRYEIILHVFTCKVFHADICHLSVLQSLCCEIKQRRRGVASVLRLCQHLLDDQETCNLNADHQSMQLIIVNLERRWEAIVMQAVQWQTRLQKRLEKDSVSDVYVNNISCNFIFHQRHFSVLGKQVHLRLFSSSWRCYSQSLLATSEAFYFFTKHCIVWTPQIKKINSQYAYSVCWIFNLIISDSVE